MPRFCRWFSQAAVAGILIAGMPAQAASQHEHLAYSMMFGGLHVGDAIVELKQTPDSYTTGMKLTARGVARWLREFQANMSGEGALHPATEGDHLHPLPVSFRRDWKGGEYASTMVMTYDPATRVTHTDERYTHVETGEDVAIEDLPWNKDDRDEDRRKPVPEDMRAGALDPMAAFVAARHQILAQNVLDAPTEFRVPVYDGRRRYDVVGKTAPPREVTINDVSYRVITVTTTLAPVFGFSDRSRERMRHSRGRILFTADARFIPVQVVIENEFLSGVMNLKADCNVTPAACAPPAEQQAAAVIN